MTDLDDRRHVEADQPARPRLHPAHVVFALVLLLLVGAVGVVVGQRTAGDRTLTDGVSTGFARDMQAHHAQAVAMSAPLHQRSDDPEVNYLAFDIMTTQQGQIGIMEGWLDLTDADEDDGETMAWMGPGHAVDWHRMPGMATQEQVAALQTLPIARATEQYLRFMVRHHAGALPMALYAADNAGHPEVRLLAQNMHDGQAAEIGLLQDMLVERGHLPEPVDAGGAHAPQADPAPGPATGPTPDGRHSGVHG